MNESPLPAQTTVVASLPSGAEGLEARRRTSPLRASLAACTAEGLAAEVVGACLGNAVIAAWGVELGVNPLLLGALFGLPFLGQVLQLPAAWVTSAFGRKRVSVAMHTLARQVTLPIAVLPFVELPAEVERAALAVLFGASALFSVVGHNAWLAWMGDLVPARIRGAYFGRRAAMCAAVATASAIGIAAVLDAGRARSALGPALAAILVVRSASGVVTTVLTGVPLPSEGLRCSAPQCLLFRAPPTTARVAGRSTARMRPAAWEVPGGLYGLQEVAPRSERQSCCSSASASP